MIALQTEIKKTTDTELNKLMAFVKRKILKSYKDNGLKACGKFGRSLTAKIQGNTGQLWAVDYVENMEFGTPAGTIVSINKLTQWIECKRISKPAQFKTINDFAFAIAKSIKKKGTIAYRNGGTYFVEKGINEADIEKHLDRISEELMLKTFITIGNQLQI